MIAQKRRPYFGDFVEVTQMTFSDKITALMRERRVTAKELSEKLSIGKNQFKYWADKGNTPNAETVSKIADYFGVSVDYLIGNTDDPSTEKKKPALTESQIDLDEIDPVKAELIKSVLSMKREDVEKISQFFDLLKKS